MESGLKLLESSVLIKENQARHQLFRIFNKGMSNLLLLIKKIK